MPVDGENEEIRITEDQILAEGLLVESGEARVIVPKRGKLFEEDGTCKIAIIRPCVSRGRRVRGLPPIYTPKMLAENAATFSGWLMYMDHLTERIVEMLQERGRSIRELGGRVTQSYYDPELRLPDDDDYGYRPGGVVGRALPQPAVRSMLEADPEILHVSINAYPKGVTSGTAPWDPSLKGMLIEGIRSKPPGSVDWVPRGGAGGRPLMEGWEATAVSLLESFYDSARGEQQMDWKNMTRDQLLREMREQAPDLARELNLHESEPAPVSMPGTLAVEAITEAALNARLAEERADFEEALAEAAALTETMIEERAAEIVAEREQARKFEEIAHRMIDASGLKEGWKRDLKRRYSVGDDGPAPALLVEAEMNDGLVVKEAAEVLKEHVDADLRHATELISESSSGHKPRVTGLGGGSANGEAAPKAPRRSSFRDFLRESGDKFGDTPEDFDKGLREMVREGVQE